MRTFLIYADLLPLSARRPMYMGDLECFMGTFEYQCALAASAPVLALRHFLSHEPSLQWASA